MHVVQTTKVPRVISFGHERSAQDDHFDGTVLFGQQVTLQNRGSVVRIVQAIKRQRPCGQFFALDWVSLDIVHFVVVAARGGCR